MPKIKFTWFLCVFALHDIQRAVLLLESRFCL